MKKEILFVLLNEFADTESAYIASLLNFGLGLISLPTSI